MTPTEKPVTFSSTTDYEEVLLPLRRALESRGLRLLCNRFRRNAFVSSMARQMSDGLGCYLVQPGEPVRPDTVVSSLGSAPAEDVVSEAEQEEFIRLWIDSCN
ncbi:hypothetical protein GT755_30015 [Herbidospora sp. NEAU-GS84]|uniref:Uncharacterized protein n=1 Tax=Herbidospora solisilvae TaxID=2696284 RepID=A0A7C9JIP5_9ACTN|nr:hypothetical protein [Herbidospora solisilvae]NAS25903.1 hypothetical protein [Herbidospora solisilvae]